jgi:hypothetical protein
MAAEECHFAGFGCLAMDHGPGRPIVFSDIVDGQLAEEFQASASDGVDAKPAGHSASRITGEPPIAVELQGVHCVRLLTRKCACCGQADDTRGLRKRIS